MIKVNSAKFNDALNMVSGVCNGKIMNILGSVKLDVDSSNKKLKLIASNSEVQIETSCDVDGDCQSGCIDADKLNKFVKANTSKDELTITMGSDNKALLRGKSQSTVNILNASDFPEMKIDLSKSVDLKISASDLASAFDSVLHCVAVGDARPFLNGVSFRINNGELIVVGSDSYRLSRVVLPSGTHNDVSIDCIIPLNTAKTIAKTFKSGDINVILNKSSLSITDGETTIIGKNIDAKFPDFSRVFDVDRNNHAVVSRVELVSGIEAVLLTATDVVKRVELTFNDNNLHIESSNSQGEKSETDVPCEYDGEEFVFVVNADYALQSIKKISGDVNINWYDNTSVILTEQDCENTIHLLMPIIV